MNVFVNRKFKGNEKRILEVLEKHFPYAFSMTKNYISDGSYLDFLHVCILRDIDFNYKGVLAFYDVAEVLKAHPEQDVEIWGENANEVYVAFLEVAGEWRGMNLGVDMMDLLQDRYFSRVLALTSKSDELVDKYYLKTGRFKINSDTNRRKLVFIKDFD